MLIIFDEQHKANFTFLAGLHPSVYPELVKLSLQFLGNKYNAKLVITAANKLQVSQEELNSGLETISHCLIEAAIQHTDADQLTNSLLFTSAELSASLVACYKENREVLVKATELLSVQKAQYNKLEWRLESQIDSQTLHSSVKPAMLTKWSITQGNKVSEHHLHCDVNTFKHITEELKLAQSQLETFHSRRMLRNLKNIP